MAELESKATPEVQAEAQKMGWIPPERYKKAPEQFVDADEFVERGKGEWVITKITPQSMDMKK